jgi:enoyl-CoA hydratase/carnithine racemase
LRRFKPRHFLWQLDGKVATMTLNRPERKNPLTLESYGELRDTFRDLVYADGVKSVVITRRNRKRRILAQAREDLWHHEVELEAGRKT